MPLFHLRISIFFLQSHQQMQAFFVHQPAACIGCAEKSRFATLQHDSATLRRLKLVWLAFPLSLSDTKTWLKIKIATETFTQTNTLIYVLVCGTVALKWMRTIWFHLKVTRCNKSEHQLGMHFYAYTYVYVSCYVGI